MTDDVLDGFLSEVSERDTLRVALHYEGDTHDILYKRDDITAEFTAEEFEEMAKNAILKALDDVPEQSEFNRWGTLDVTARWFNEVILVQIPLGEWEGVMLSFDRDSLDDYGELVNDLLSYVDTELREDASSEAAAEEHFS
ncbi:hypothetical protein [Salarchaeum sp. JOR-1]|uniref:hypothetical protein n=1 Tax=Salarchaeum sp. JOR-1 TaxID=2599399 RepID=UPI0011987EA8|nr:hypothetical protein [Salarchaeum sp. JOR-1]QDX41391.1 hypothetical protein FQU85_10950 [Salarchaeum sp. JOR-1]